MATTRKTFWNAASRTSTSMVHSKHTRMFPHETNDRCKFEGRKVAELKKKHAPFSNKARKKRNNVNKETEYF
jgi:hypothetical protein